MIRIVEWFSGIKAFTKALEKQGVEYEMVDSVELDKHAIKSQNALYGTNYKPTDINDVNVNAYGEVDILIAGWVCTSMSTAGKQRGMGDIVERFYLEPNINNVAKWYYEANANGSYADFMEEFPSGLIFTSLVKLNEMTTKPKYIILENVKGLLSEKFAKDFALIKTLFTELGYQWNQALLNSKYFDVPQSRERVFIVLTRNDLPMVDITPLLSKNKVNKALKDVIDFDAPAQAVELVEGNYLQFSNFITLPRQSDGKLINGFHNRYWSVEKQSGTNCAAATPKLYYFNNALKNYNGKVIQLDLEKFNNQNSQEINKVAMLGTLVNVERERERESLTSFQEHTFNQKKDFLGIDGVSKTLRAGDCEQENKIAYQRIPFNEDSRFLGTVGLSPTLVATSPDFKNKILYNLENTIFYRPLTPRECLLLMGFESNDYDRLKQAGVSDSQICKQCGNSIVVNVLEEILKIILRKLVE